MSLTEEDLLEMLPSQRQPTNKNRINWSITYMKNAGLVQKVSHGTYVITDLGQKALNEVGDKIDLSYLGKFESFVKFQRRGLAPQKAKSGTVAIPEETPMETIEKAYQTLRDELASSLLASIMDCSPDFFERLVIDLLLAMGYGYDSQESGMVVGRTGDGGIDGIINEDKLGFSQVYVQAKRWDPEHTIGRPDVQTFAGALLGKGATKGLYITTAQFTKAAREYVNDQKAMRVVLVDGEDLTRLMIDNGVGVSVQHTFTVKQIDGDYFEDT